MSFLSFTCSSLLPLRQLGAAAPLTARWTHSSTSSSTSRRPAARRPRREPAVPFCIPAAARQDMRNREATRGHSGARSPQSDEGSGQWRPRLDTRLSRTATGAAHHLAPAAALPLLPSSPLPAAPTPSPSPSSEAALPASGSPRLSPSSIPHQRNKPRRPVRPGWRGGGLGFDPPGHGFDERT
jgi:hypothetical protein